MIDVKQIVVKKAHEASMIVLKKTNIPEELIKQFTLEFLEDIAKSLSKVTRDSFIYTGKMKYDETNGLCAYFTSSSQEDSITLCVSYCEETKKVEHSFENLDKTIEKNLNKETEKEEKVNQEEKLPVEKEPTKIKDFGKIVDTTIKQDKKQKLDNKFAAISAALEKKEKVVKINKILDKAIEKNKQEEEKKQENPLFKIIKGKRNET